MEDTASDMSATDAGDALAEFCSLSLVPGFRSQSFANAPRENTNNADHSHSFVGGENIDETNDDVLFVGTNIKVKSDMTEKGVRESNTTGSTADSMPRELQTERYVGDCEMRVGAASEDVSCVDSPELYGSGGSAYYADEASEDGLKLGAENSGANTAEDEITAVPKVPHYSSDKPQTGFLLNFFRGRGSKATLKSVVKGKTVYNKIIDLDADCGTPCEFEDVNDAIQHVASSRPGCQKAGSVSGAVSNASYPSNRRHRSYRNEQVCHHDYNDHRARSGQTIIGLGRMDPVQMGRWNHYDSAGGSRGVNMEKQPMTPDLFNGWVRAIFNVTVMTVLLYLVMVGILAFRRDIGNNVERRRQTVKSDAMLCQENYRKNKCRTMKVPALESQCREWEACMYKDAILYDDASLLSAEVLGSVLNRFVSQLDTRTVGILLAGFLALFVGSNCALSMSSAARPPSQGWFKGWFSRNSPPPNGSDLLQNTQFLLNPQLMHAMHNPYLQPNYCVMGSYPYVNPGDFVHPYSSDVPSYYHDNHSEEHVSPVKGGRTSAWKRRFMSPWVDQE
ncbi:hypothetical protein X943_002232 [Babesia divergens]|uniref:Brl1/Brr6 domain-containing protein n=1 Tax=Babesia divergens TaxID=32595 RepID=A0AAD9GFT7_BABDI|nr:hypothetical protein X943_002232 [Babesia divergens]